MADVDLRTNPDALPHAEPPRIGRHSVNGTTLYAEVRGSGPPVLLIHAGAEDAEEWRPVAERLSEFTVVTYDRRGTLRSGRENWPGEGSTQHADDAAGLLHALELHDVIVFGGSSGGNIALQLALRHPTLVRRALVWEPGFFRQVAGGEEMYWRMRAAADDYLDGHRFDWAGAYAALLRSLALTPDQPSSVPATVSEPRSWYDQREDANAETLLVDDVPILTHEIVDEAELASSAADIRFAYGTESRPVFRQIALHLALARSETPDVLEGVGHVMLYHPDKAAAYIRAQNGVGQS